MRGLTRWAIPVIAASLISACSSAPASTPTSIPVAATSAPTVAPAPTSAPTAAPTAVANPTAVPPAGFPVTIENCGRNLTFNAPPQRVISLWQPPTEMLLALGVQDQIAALAGNYTELRADFTAAAAPIKVIGDGMQWPSKEVLLSEQPDLVISEGLEGFAYDVSKGYASVADIEATGAQVISTGGSCTPTDPASQTKSIATVYNDLKMLGTIFGVSERAESLIAELQAREAEITAKVAGSEPVPVAFYNGGEGPLFVLSFGIWADLMEKAGGVNVIKTDGFQISVEEFAASQPEVILVGYYPGQDPATAIEFLTKTFPNIPAVQNKRLVPIATINTEASVRVIDGLEQIAQALHPEAFATATSPAANPFNLSLAQYYLDNAGFHGMATTISDTNTIDASYLTKVTRVTKVLKQTTWPAELNEQAQTFLSDLDAFAAALTAGDVAAAKETSETVHDAQHELSHEVDHWLGESQALPSEAAPFGLSVAQYLLDTTGFHGMATTISDTNAIDASYLTKVTRVTKVLKQTAWPAELNEQAQTFLSDLDAFAAALTAGDVVAAKETSETVHDAQHELSHEVDHWLGEGQALPAEASNFEVSVAQYLLDTAGFHGMASTISDTVSIDPAYLTTVNRVSKVFKQTTWPNSLSEQAQTFLSDLDAFAAALTAGDVAAAKETSEAVHDAQHELSHALDDALGNTSSGH